MGIKLSDEVQEKVTRIVKLLKKSSSILFITGAGISAESGLPTYRGIGGLYNDVTTDEGIPIETALAGETLYAHPEITWKYISQIEKRSRHARFNRAHEVIAQMEKAFGRVWVLTQNIDGFHFDAGSHNVIDIHGDMHKLLCPGCQWRREVKDYTKIEIPPLCPKCNTIVRPEVVFFGEMLPFDKLEVLSRQLNKGFDIYFSVGTTSVFPYIKQPILDAKSLKAPTVEINPSDTEVSYLVDIKLASPAGEALDKIWTEYNK